MEEPVWATVHGVTKSRTQLSDFPLAICLVLSSGRSQFITRVGNLSRVSILHINVNWDIHFVTFIRSTRSCYCGYCFCCSDAKSCPTPCDPMDCSIPGFPVHNLPEFAQTHVHWVSDAIQSSHALFPPSPAFNLSWHQDPMSQLFASRGQSIGASASASVLPIQGWFPLE